MNNETKEQLQSLSDNMSNLNYDEILFRSNILLRSIELITLIKRIEPEDFDEMINGYAEVLRFYADDLKKISTIHVHDCMKINQKMLKILDEKRLKTLKKNYVKLVLSCVKLASDYVIFTLLCVNPTL